MKAKICLSVDEANRWIEKNSINVSRIDIQQYTKSTTGISWSEERVIVYYMEVKDATYCRS